MRGRVEVVAGTSLDIGSVRLTERHHRTDPPTQEVVDAARFVPFVDAACRAHAPRR